ncbi:MAG: diguanylate cyclase [candidate division WOR-3 bacterium]
MAREGYSIYLDELTKAYNRRYLISFLDHEIKKIKRYGGKSSVLFIDLDNFKTVNDLLGHLEGDRFLVNFVQSVKSTLRESDIIARYGGDEFVIILPNTSAESAVNVAQRILDILKEREQYGTPVSLCSIGIVEIPTHGLDYETILSRADKALYKAKRMGKARYFIYSEDIPYPQIPSKTFIGRHAEKTELLRAIKGNSPLILIKGSTGIGKSRFVNETLKILENYVTLETGCYGTLSSIPFVPFKELTKKISETFNVKFREFYVRLDEFDRKALSPVLPETLPGVIEHIDRYKFYETFFEFLTFISGDKAAIIFIDDIQWMDKSSTELLYYLLRLSKNRLKFLATARSEDLRDTPIESLIPMVSREGLLSEMEVGPLNESSINELTESILQAPISEKLKKTLFLKSGGNPLFVEELIRELYEKELIKFNGEEWDLLTEDFSWVPERVELVLKNKLKYFSGDPVLEVAAVIGHEFDLKIVQSVTKMNFGEILDTVDKLLRQNLIEEKDVDRFAFKEDIIRDAILSEMSSTKKKYYSSLILEALETSLKSVEGKEELCAFHAKQAGNIEKLKLYSKSAAEKLSRIFAYEESIKFYQWYLDAEEDPKLKEEAFLSYLRILEIKGHLKRAIEETHKFIETHTPNSKLYKALAELYIESGDTKSAKQYIEKSLEMEYDPDAVSLKAWILRRLNQVQEAKALLEDLLNKYLDKMKEETLATVYTIQALNYADLNDVEKSLELLDKAEEIRRRLNIVKGVGSVHVNRAIVYSHIGEYEKALEEYDKAEECYRKVGYKSGLLTVLNNKAAVYLDLNMYKEALYNFRKTFVEAEKVFDRHLQVMSLNNVGVTLRQIEEHEEALEAFKKAYDIASQLEMRDILTNIRRNMAYTLAIGLKDLEHAIPIIDSVISEIGMAGLTYNSIIAYLHAVEIFILGKQPERAENLLEKLVKVIEVYPFKELKIDFYVKYAFLKRFYKADKQSFGKTIHKAFQIVNSESRYKELKNSFREAIADILIYFGNVEEGLKILNYMKKSSEKFNMDQETERLERKIDRVIRLFK